MTGGILPNPGDPYEVAAAILDDYRHNGCHTLQYWRGTWMRWEDTCWAEVERDEIKASIYKALHGATYLDNKGIVKPWRPTKARVAEIVDALEARTQLPGSVDAPAWLQRHTIPPTEIVACTNGLLHVQSRSLGALTPYYFNRVAVPFDYRADAPKPKRWLAFLQQLWGHDPESIHALQEFFGYILAGRTDLQKILFVKGPPRSGKGTIARVLKELVGRGNFIGLTPDSLASNFGLAPLVDKPLAVIPDARFGGPNVRVAIERMLSISGEDTLTVDRKYKDAWTGRLPTRLIVMSNEDPRLTDASAAIINRFIVLTLTESFFGREDIGLEAALLAEMPGVLLWALDGLDRLEQRGRFTVPQSSEDTVSAMFALASPVSAFVRDRCATGPEYEVPRAGLYKAWTEWCDANGWRKTTTATFGRDLRAVVPGIRDVRRTTYPGWNPPRHDPLASNQGSLDTLDTDSSGRIWGYGGITLQGLGPGNGPGAVQGDSVLAADKTAGQSGNGQARPGSPSISTERSREVDREGSIEGVGKTLDSLDTLDAACPHGIPGGALPHPGFGVEPRCLDCRSPR